MTPYEPSFIKRLPADAQAELRALLRIDPPAPVVDDVADVADVADEDEWLDPTEPTACPHCDGEVVVLGALGRKVWGRCRRCGLDVSVDIDDAAGY
jgi:hypothetical protein